jgi:hypothetical protein
MATAKRKTKDGAPTNGQIVLKLTQDEADLIRSVFGDLFHTGSMPREREIVSDIYYALNEFTVTRGYALALGDAGSRPYRPRF